MLRRSMALLLACALWLLSGCGAPAQTFQYDIPDDPSSLDPQLATDVAAWVVLRNIFEGLVVADDFDHIELAGATGYTVSEDGRQYTFTLKPDAVWRNDDPVTAHDYVFAFRRLADPATGAGNTLPYQAIRGFRAALEGQIAPSSIGVEALDDLTLRFTLEREDESFLYNLSLPTAYPCNEAFFRSTNAKYGRSARYLTTNGPFYLNSWEEGVSLQLRRNGRYVDADEVEVTLVTLRIERDEAAITERFFAGTTDAALVSGEYLDALTQGGYRYDSYANRTWVILFNLAVPELQNTAMRQALARCIDLSTFAHLLPDYAEAAEGLVPPVVEMDGMVYRETVEPLPLVTDAEAARELFKTACEELGVRTLRGASLILPESSGYALSMSFVQRSWQDVLGVYINREPLDSETFYSRLRSGDFAIALVPLMADENTPAAVLGDFQSDSNTNYSRYQNETFDQLVAEAEMSDDRAHSYAVFREAERMLVEEAVAVPVTFETSYGAIANDVERLDYSPFAGNIRFRDAAIG